MPTHVALLRGVNVGGVKVAMADLRAVVAGLGHTDVSTYIQSGNVVFSAREPDSAVLAADLERAIGQAFGRQIAVVVLSRDELAQVVKDTPYPDEPNPRYVHAVFFGEPPGPGVVDAVTAAQQQAAAKGSRDEFAVAGRTLFLHTPDGYGRSELGLRVNRIASGAVAGTARNWATVTKLLSLCGS